MRAPTWDGRCPAAHVADPRSCDGQHDAVRVIDQTGVSTAACLLHGAVLLASLHRGRVYPLNGPKGSAIAVFALAQTLPAFGFLTGPAVARVSTANWSDAGQRGGRTAAELAMEYPTAPGVTSAKADRHSPPAAHAPVTLDRHPGSRPPLSGRGGTPDDQLGADRWVPREGAGWGLGSAHRGQRGGYRRDLVDCEPADAPGRRAGRQPAAGPVAPRSRTPP